MKPIHLGLLAPARRCNQRCPKCAITEVFREPVHVARLTPQHFVDFVRSFVESDQMVSTVSFQGYEVTLPESWPYLEAVFRFALRVGLRRTLVTNGLLLSRRVDSLLPLDPSQVTVSLDGGTPEVNDAARGVPGAFRRTLTSLTRFIEAAPALRKRVVVASCVFDRDTFQSLKQLPSRLCDLGIERWTLSVPLTAKEVSVTTPDFDETWLHELARYGERFGIRTHFIDPVGFLRSEGPLSVVRPTGLDRVFRLDPGGTIRTGDALMEVYDDRRAFRWDPSTQSAAAACGIA